MKADIHRTLAVLLTELVDGTPADSGWILNPEDVGLLGSLGRLTAAAASAPARGTGSSVAAHVDHVCFGIELFNRWSAGEENPFAGANWGASWARTTVTEDEWTALRARLRNETHKWVANVQRSRELQDAELTGIVASVAHLAYHVGAIRQIDHAVAGPQAAD
jgi:hypothetical protein